MDTYTWLVARLSMEEAAWLPGMLMQQVEKENSAAESATATQGEPLRPEDRVTWQANMGPDTVTLRCMDRDRLLKLAEWLLVVSDTADVLLMRTPAAPQLPLTREPLEGALIRYVFTFPDLGAYDRAMNAVGRFLKVNGGGGIRHEAYPERRFLVIAAQQRAELGGLRAVITLECPEVQIREYP